MPGPFSGPIPHPPRRRMKGGGKMEPDRSWEKDAEAREATIELLRICNKAGTLEELMRDLMVHFRNLTGCEAIGVRLREADDFPYFETRGFPEGLGFAGRRVW